MTEPRRTAVSYTRFSTPNQSKGDSEDRQEREYRAFCERHNLTPGKEVFADRGRSGYHDAHRKRGDLGKLVQAAKDGRFDAGTVIVIEAWDRLGRLRPDKQTELVAELLRTGVSIGLCRLNDIFTEEDFGSHKWTTLSVFISLAFNESKQKADRLCSVWTARRKRVREDGAKLGGSLPGWVERVRGEFRLVPERAAAVQRIYALAVDGFGVTRIVRSLISEKVKPFKHAAWTKAFVAQLLRDRRVIGEFQPKKRVTGKDDVRRAEPDGAVVADYYPRAVTEEQWTLARAAQSRKGRNGPRQRKYANVFRGLLYNATDKSPMNLATAAGRAGQSRLVLKSAGVAGPLVTFPYPVFERAVLSALREVTPADVIPRTDARPATSADAIRARLKIVRADLAAMKTDLATRYSRSLSDVMRQKEDEELVLANELSDELARTAMPVEKAWSEAQSLIGMIEGSSDPDAVRVRLRTALRRIVSEAWILVRGVGAVREGIVNLYFGDPNALVLRHYRIIFQPSVAVVRGQVVRPARFRMWSFHHPNDVWPCFDLRDKDEVRNALGLMETHTRDHLVQLLDDGYQYPAPWGTVELPR